MSFKCKEDSGDILEDKKVKMENKIKIKPIEHEKIKRKNFLEICINIIHKIIKNTFKITLLKNFPRYSEVAIKENLGKDLIGVEIGVYKGENAKRMLSSLPIKMLYLVDPYELYKEWDYEGEVAKVNKNTMKKLEETAKKRLKHFKNKIIWIKKKSEDAFKDIPNNLDFVYIDAAHDYFNVKKDTENYYPKIKKGGILAGHDFGREGLTRAVWEFSVKIKQCIKIRLERGSDWVLFKPKEFGGEINTIK